MLQISDLTYRIAGRVLLDQVSATINKGERVGLVGRNGSGKTSLLKLISGELAPDSGALQLPKRLRVAKVAQHAPSGPENLLDTVLAADQERTRLLAEAESAAHTNDEPAAIAEIHERLLAIDAESAPARAARILAGLGFDEAAQQRPCQEFSGGWQMRVALAALLFSDPDLLLLDEPTNHLDLEATIWLESYLRGYRGTLLLISHERGLLNRVPTKILHLAGHKLAAYGGNYDRFERTRREQLMHQAAMQARQEAQRKHMQGFIDRFRYKASKARQAQSRIKALERMEPIASVIEARTVSLQFPDCKPLPPPLLALDRVAVGYTPDTPVLSRLNLRLDMDDRIALLGANGNGKSTFVRLLAQRLAPQDGDVTRSKHLKVGYFAQDQADELDLEATPLTLIQRLMPQADNRALRGYLGRFGFGQDKVEVEVGKLSGGERARLLFAVICREAPQLLLLDEPTNHLDVDTREALIQSLNAYQGAVVLVSHDPHLIELVADRLWLVADGTVKPYEGDLEDYRRFLLGQRRNGKTAAVPDAPQAAQSQSRKKDKRRAAAEARAAVSDQRKAVRDAEQRIERLSRERAALEAKLADPAIYDGPTAKLMALQVRHGQLKQALAEAEETWLEAQAALE